MKNFPLHCVVIFKTTDVTLMSKNENGLATIADRTMYRIGHVRDPNEFFLLEQKLGHWLGIWMKKHFNGAPFSEDASEAEKLAGDILNERIKLQLPVAGIVTIDASKYSFPLI